MLGRDEENTLLENPFIQYHLTLQSQEREATTSGTRYLWASALTRFEMLLDHLNTNYILNVNEDGDSSTIEGVPEKIRLLWTRHFASLSDDKIKKYYNAYIAFLAEKVGKFNGNTLLVRLAIYQEKPNPFPAIFAYMLARPQEEIKHYEFKYRFLTELLRKIGMGENIKEFCLSRGYASEFRIHMHQTPKNAVNRLPALEMATPTLKRTGKFASLITPLKHYPALWLQDQLNKTLRNYPNFYNPFTRINNYFEDIGKKSGAELKKYQEKFRDLGELIQKLQFRGETTFAKIITDFMEVKYKKKLGVSEFRYLMKLLTSYSEEQLQIYFDAYEHPEDNPPTTSIPLNPFVECLNYLKNPQDEEKNARKEDVFCEMLQNFKHHQHEIERSHNRYQAGSDEATEQLKTSIKNTLTTNNYLKKEFTLFQKIHGGVFANLITQFLKWDDALIEHYAAFQAQINAGLYATNTLEARIKHEITNTQTENNYTM